MNTLEPLTEKEKQEWIGKINKMDQTEMARMFRFAPAGHPVFSTLNEPLFDIFMARFNELGGMTSQVSKMIWW